MLLQLIYKLVCSAWSNDNVFIFKNDVDVKLDGPQLCVALATIFTGVGYSGTKVAIATLERDNGLFIVHIDLGNYQHVTQIAGYTFEPFILNFFIGESCTLTDSIVGPMNPGQIVVHKLEECTAAIITPSNLCDLDD
ncbi:hypothetical protein ACHAW6_002902 [Cyclotella cf. meneghiniana]